MKKWVFQALLVTLFSFVSLTAADNNNVNSRSLEALKTFKIGTVNFKTCVEESKVGKQEQASFEKLKKQMETTLEEKEKVLNDLAVKLNDPDQLDLMSAEAETKLKRDFRSLSQELNQIQTQYYQALNQANVKIVQKLADLVTESSKKVAEDLRLIAILNDESCFFANKDLDVSEKVVMQMDRLFNEQTNKTDSSNTNF